MEAEDRKVDFLSENSKQIKCQIYDSIRIGPMAVAIINTPEFQRLRNIKQLGVTNYVYPSAVHTRFEHSLGVYHLAGIMVDKIRQLYPAGKYHLPSFGDEHQSLSEDIAECIKLAGLCHDLGHGPFSHIFDDTLLAESNHQNKCHETRSCLIAEIICRRELGSILSEKHINFITSLIHPGEKDIGALYQIVSNSMNGIDVDKFDYVIRDSYNLGLSIPFKPARLLTDFIIDDGGNIAYPKQCSNDIFHLFFSRYDLHKTVYSHKTTKIVEVMVKDLFKILDRVYSLSTSIEDMSKFCKLTDNSIFEFVKVIDSPICHIDGEIRNELEKAARIVEALETRKFYKRIVTLTENVNANATAILTLVRLSVLEKYPEIDPNNIMIVSAKVAMMSGEGDLFKNIYLYDKKESRTTFIKPREEYSCLLKADLHEKQLHLICKQLDMVDTIRKDVQQYLNSLETNVLYYIH